MAGPAFDDRDGVIWYDGQLDNWRDAKVHVLTHAMHYASAVFEGERAYSGVIFKSTKHSERLKESARILDFEIPYSVAEIDAAKALVLQKMGLKDAYIRPIAWRFQGDYVHTSFFGTTQNNVRISTCIVLRF